MAAVNVYLKMFVALYVMVNPLEGLPIFLERTETLDERARVGIGHTAALSVTCILLVTLAVGHELLNLFNISVGDFT
jgi:multiple antibiotic resistance protein